MGAPQTPSPPALLPGPAHGGRAGGGAGGIVGAGPQVDTEPQGGHWTPEWVQDPRVGAGPWSGYRFPEWVQDPRVGAGPHLDTGPQDGCRSPRMGAGLQGGYRTPGWVQVPSWTEDPRVGAGPLEWVQGPLGGYWTPKWVQDPRVGAGPPPGPSPALTPCLLTHAQGTCGAQRGWAPASPAISRKVTAAGGTSAPRLTDGCGARPAWTPGARGPTQTTPWAPTWVSGSCSAGERAPGTHSTALQGHGCPEAGVLGCPSLWGAGAGADPWWGRSGAGRSSGAISQGCSPCSAPCPPQGGSW